MPASSYRYRCVQAAAILVVTAATSHSVPHERCVRHARTTLDDDLCCCCCCCCLEECCRGGTEDAFGKQSLFHAQNAKCHSQCLNCFGTSRGAERKLQRPPRKLDDKTLICCEDNNNNNEHDDADCCCCCDVDNNNNNNPSSPKTTKRIKSGQRERTRVEGSRSRIRSKINIPLSVAFPENNRLQQRLQDQIKRFQFDGPSKRFMPELQNNNNKLDLLKAEPRPILRPNVKTAKKIFDVSRPAVGSNRPSDGPASHVDYDDETVYGTKDRGPYGVKKEGFCEGVICRNSNKIGRCECGGTATEDEGSRRNAAITCSEVSPSVNEKRLENLPLVSSMPEPIRKAVVTPLPLPPPPPQPIPPISSVDPNLLTTATSQWATLTLPENSTTTPRAAVKSEPMSASQNPSQQLSASDTRPGNTTTDQSRTVAFEDMYENQRYEETVNNTNLSEYGTVASRGDGLSQMTDTSDETVYSQTSATTNVVAILGYNNVTTEAPNNISTTVEVPFTNDAVPTVTHLTVTTLNETVTIPSPSDFGCETATSNSLFSFNYVTSNLPQPPDSATTPAEYDSAVMENLVMESAPPSLKFTAEPIVHAVGGLFAFTHDPIGRLENAVYLGDNNEFIEGSSLHENGELSVDRLYGTAATSSSTWYSITVKVLESPTTTMTTPMISNEISANEVAETTLRSPVDSQGFLASAEGSSIITVTSSLEGLSDSSTTRKTMAEDSTDASDATSSMLGTSRMEAMLMPPSDFSEPNDVNRDFGSTMAPATSAITTTIVEVGFGKDVLASTVDVAQESTGEESSSTASVVVSMTTAKTTLSEIDILEKFLIETNQSPVTSIMTDAVAATSAPTEGETTPPTTTSTLEPGIRGSTAATVRSITTVAVPRGQQHRVLVARKAEAPPHHDALVAGNRAPATGRSETIDYETDGINADAKRTNEGTKRSCCRLIMVTTLLWLSAFLPLFLTR